MQPIINILRQTTSCVWPVGTSAHRACIVMQRRYRVSKKGANHRHRLVSLSKGGRVLRHDGNTRWKLPSCSGKMFIPTFMRITLCSIEFWRTVTKDLGMLFRVHQKRRHCSAETNRNYIHPVCGSDETSGRTYGYPHYVLIFIYLSEITSASCFTCFMFI
jgi:hypothetical protein